MAKTISNTYTTTQVLSNPATDNPSTVTSAGIIDVNSTISGAAGIFGSSGFAWTLTNLGTVESIGSLGVGIVLASGGVVTNGTSGAATAFVEGSQTGISVAGAAGTVANYGTISTTGTAGTAINLGAGGTVSNGASGSTAALIDGIFGVQINGGAGTVTNFGTVQHAGSAATGAAIFLGAGGLVTNYGTIAGSGTAGNLGKPSIGVVIIHGSPGAGTVKNFGTIATTTTNGNGVNLDSGGTIINGSTSVTAATINASSTGVYVGGTNGTLTSGGTGLVFNYGTIAALGSIVNSAGSIVSGNGVFLAAGGHIQNGSSDSTTGLIKGYHIGILIHGSPTTVVNFGTIESLQTAVNGYVGVGIQMDNGGYLANHGLITSAQRGVSTGNTPGAVGTVVNSGTIEGKGNTAGNGVNFAQGGTVTNQASGLITAYRIGIFVHNTAGTIDNFGTIQSTAGTSFTAGFGVYLGAGGLITNEAGGSITSQSKAVSVGGTTSAAVTVTNSGNITGSVGISINAADTGDNTIDNFGTITGTGGGAILMVGGVVTNEAGAIIDGKGGNAVSASTAGTAVTLTNLGTVQNASTTNSTVYLGHGGIVTNGATSATGAAIIGTGTSGSSISIKFAAGTVTNFGTISNAGTFNNAVYLGAGGSVTNAASGTIIAPWLGVNLKNVAGTVSNLGTIESTATFTQSGTLRGVGVLLQQGGTVVNGVSGSTSGLIQGYELGVYIGGGGGTPNSGAVGLVFNYGTIASVGTGANAAPAAELSSGGTITNRGTIESVASNAITVKGTVAGTVVNFGTVEQTGTGTTGQAIYLAAGGTVTNFGLISGAHPGTPLVGTSGGYPGVISTKNQRATVVNFGTIANPNNSNGINLLDGGRLVNGSTSVTAALINAPHGGVYMGGSAGVAILGAIGTVVNYGTIQNTTTESSAVRLVSGGTVTNHGLISSGRTGISFGNTAGTIDNFATVVSTAPASFTLGAGIYLGAGGLIANEAGASIAAADLRAAVQLGNTVATGAAAIVSNHGTITGYIGIGIGPGDTGNNTIDNFGTITGTGGTAIRLGAGNDRVIIEAGSVLQGVISGFHPGDGFDLPFMSFSSTGTVTLNPSTHALQIVENAGTYTINLDPAQSFLGDAFQLTPDSGGGTLVTETAPMATQWTNSAGGDWTITGNWSAGVPTSSIDATLGTLSGNPFYTVTLTGAGSANSLTLTNYPTLSISTTSGGTPASLAIQGNLSNAGRLYVDNYFSNTGGSTLTIGGTLINSNTVYIGNTSLVASTTVTAGALATTGTIDLFGGTGSNTNQATLDIVSGAAPSVLFGNLALSGRTLVEFASGSIASIANNTGLYLHGANAFIADAGNIGSNSALGGLASNAGTFVMDDGASVQIQGNFSNSGNIYVDYYYATIGGSSLTIGGTLNNTGSLYIGQYYQTTSGSTVSAAGLANAGTISLYGGTGTNTTQATLDISSGAAPSVLAGTLSLTGHALVEFAGGSIITNNANLYLHGKDALVADAFDTTGNSALSGLTGNAGTVELDSGASIRTAGDFNNSGTVYVDFSYSLAGGSLLSIGGMLSNRGSLYIGDNAQTGSMVSAAGLTPTGNSYIYLTGGTGTNTAEATLDITSGGAPSVLAGHLELTGHALVEFAGGSIGGIALNSGLFLHGTNAFVADAGNTSSNSALSGLASNAGTLDLDSGAQVQTQGDFYNGGTIYLDYYYSTSGGSSLTIGGTLSNNATIIIGSSNPATAGSTVSAAGLADTGSISLYGGTGSNTFQSTLDITSGTAPSVLIGNLDLYGRTLVEFAGGQITSIANGGEVFLGGASAFIADAGNTTSNSALSGLASNAGTLDLDGGATVQTTGDFANFGTVTVNSYNYGSGGSMLAVGGMLTNTGALTIGTYYQIAPTTVTASSFVDTGYVYLYGGNGTDTNQSTLDITSGAAPTVLTGYFYLSGHALAEFASGSITGIAGNSTLAVNGGSAFVADAGNITSNSALTGLANNAGTLDLENGASIHTPGNFANLGTLYLDISYTSGGSTLTIDGALTNTGNLYIGNLYDSAATTLSAAALTNGGLIQLYGGTGTGAGQATLDITGPATDTGRIYLYGDAVLNAGSLTVANGGTITVSSGGTTSGVTVGPGGSEIVSSGGTSVAPTIAGGILELASGTVSGGGIAFVGSGGTLQIDSDDVMPTNTISGFGPGDAIDLRGLTFGSTATVNYDPTTSGLTVSAGGVTDTLTMAGVASGTLFVVAGDGHGGRLVTEAPLSGGTQWTNSAGGSWTSSANWSGGVPTSSTDATIGVAGGYTVSLTTSGGANSLTIDHPGASLALGTNSGSGTSASLAIQGNLNNGGGVYVDSATGQSGSTLSIGGALVNTDLVQIGNGSGSPATTVSAASVSNSSVIYLRGGASGGPTLATTGGFTNTDFAYIDVFGSEGGSTLTVGGTLTNTYNIYIGNTALSAATTVSAAGLANTGTITLNGGTGSNRATLDIISGSAPSVLTGDFQLSGHALLEFAGGSIASIANGGTVFLAGGSAFVADASNTASNSALTGLSNNAGTLELEGGAVVQTQGDFINNRSLYVYSDPSYGSGSSGLGVAGTLTNVGSIFIGNNSNTTSAATVTAAGLANTGAIYLTGGTGTATAQATLDIISGSAPSVLTGGFYLSGHALMEFAGGSIASIANGGTVFLAGGSAFVADASDTASNSALIGLLNNAGTLQLEGGAVVQTQGDFTNNQSLYVYSDTSYGSGSSALGVAGTLTNTGSISIGNNANAAVAATVTAASFENTGSVTLYGASGTATALTSLDITSCSAPSILTGRFSLSGDSLVEFAGGSIASIANNGTVFLGGGRAFVADASDTASNSALIGLLSNAGTLQLEGGAVVQIQGDFTNNQSLYVYSDTSYGSGSSALGVAGTLTNAGSISIGNTSNPTVAATVTAAGLDNQGYVTLTGATGTATALTSLDITSGSAPAMLAGHFSLSGNSLVEFAGSGSIAAIAGGGGIVINGGSAFVANANNTGANSALTGLSSNAGGLELDNGAALQTQGDFSNSGSLSISYYYYYTGGTMSVAGKLANSGNIYIGNGNPTVSGSTLSATDLANTGSVYLSGGIGSGTNRATLDITAGTAPSVLSGHLNLYGQSLVEFAGGQMTDIASTGGLTLIGTSAFVADAGNTGANSALNLASNAGLLELEGGATLPTAGNFVNAGTLYVDANYSYNGGTTLSFGGALTNTSAGYLALGNGYEASGTTLSAASLANAGTINLQGNYYSATNQAILDIAGAATDGGTITLNGQALLSAGSLTVTSGGRLNIYSAGTVTGAIVGSGGLEYVYSGGASTSGTIAGGTLEMAGGTVTAATIGFTARGGTLRIDGTQMPTNTVTGFGSHQTIDLRAVSSGVSGSASISPTNMLVVNEGGTAYTLQLDPNRNYSSATVNLISDSAGGTAVTLTIPPQFVYSGQSMTISAGDTEDNITVLSGGLLTVLSGGTATDTIDFGTEVLGGGLDLNGMIGSGGTMLVSAGGVASITNVATLGQMNVLSGGSATSAAVTGGGAVMVQSGGITISSVLLGSGASFTGTGTIGSAEFLLGGTAVATTVSSGGALFVSAGSREIGGTITGSGFEAVESGGAASATTVFTGGQLAISAGGTAVGAALTGGDLEVAGGTASGTIVNGGGREQIAAGATASGTTINSGGVQLDDGVAVGAIVNSGGTQFAGSGGTASNTTVHSGGIIALGSGGAFSGATINPGGAFAVVDGYVLSSFVVSGGLILDVGTGPFLSGVTLATASALATTVDSGGVANVFSGGMALGTILNAGASEVVNSGGAARGTTLSGGSEVVLFGGVASGSVLDSGASQLVFGVALGAVVSAFDVETVESGGIASGTTVSNGGREIVLSGGLTSDTTIAGGILELTSGAFNSGTTLFAGSGGVLQIDGATMPLNTIGGFAPGDTIDLAAIGGGSAGSATLGSGNVLTVSEGGSTYTLQFDPSQSFLGEGFQLTGDGSSGTNLAVVMSGTVTVQPGETLTLSAGQSVSGIVVLSGGTLVVGPGATTVGARIAGGGTEMVDSGGVASGTVIASGGTESVGSGGVARGTQIASGGTESVGSGGVASDTTISGGGFEDVFGTTTGTMIFGGGSQTIEAGGSALTTVLDDAAVQTVSGFAGGTVVSATDTQIVAAGGTASGTVVLVGGSEIVLSGGLSIDTTIFGGLVELTDGAATGGVTRFLGPGGVLRIDGSGMPSAPIAGFVRGDAIDLRGLAFSSANSVSFNSATAALSVSGSVVDMLSLPGVASGTAFALADDGQGATLVRGAPPAPSGLALAPGSDSGVVGDNLTNASSPVIAGTGEAGDTVTLFDGAAPVGNAIVGSATVGPGGAWAVTASGLMPGLNVLRATESDGAGNVSAPSAGLSVTIDRSAPQTLPVSLSVTSGSVPAPIGIAAPSDPDNPAGSLAVTVASLPGNGSVTLAGGATAVTVGEALSPAQLTGLDFIPGPNQIGSSGSFTYRVTDPADNSSIGSATLGVVAPTSASLFDFVFTYSAAGVNDGKDYYYGTVADNGTVGPNGGYQVGQQIATSAGSYIIFNKEGQTSEAPGTVVVTNYSHGGPGQASPVPLSAGKPDGSQGLGSESDAVLGTDGKSHPFSGTQQASFATGTALFGFVYTYADGAAFYTGTVADDGSFGLSGGTGAPITRTVSDSSGQVVGTYSVFSDGTSGLAPGSVVIDRFTGGDASFIPSHASPGAVDGSGGLGSEVGQFTVNGAVMGFSADVEPKLTLSVQPVPPPPTPNPADVITSELNEIYSEVLGRLPDPSGLATYSADLAGGTSPATIRQIVAGSPEAQGKVNGLYNQVFGRNADPGGLATYTAALANGSSLPAVQLILAQSPEAQIDISTIYQEVLARAPDGGGLTTYMAALAGGMSLLGVRGIVAHSPEAQTGVSGLFQEILGRPPGAAELTGMEDLLAGGATQQSLGSALSTGGSAGGFTTITAATGNAALTAPPQTPTLFVFGDIAFGNDTIAGFDPVRDTIQFAHARVADLTTLANDTTSTAGGTLITLNPNQSIQLTGIAPAGLGPANFQIV